MSEPFVERVFYLRWVPHDREMPEADRMVRVNDGIHHNYWSELVECDADGNPLP